MNLKKLFPLSYKVENGEALAVTLVLHILGYYAGELISTVLGLLASIVSGFMPVAVLNFLGAISTFVAAVGVFVSVYAVIGIVLAVLAYRKVIE